ncbi:hypothetical protein Scep_003190 [Stephania cephalantha]|uniref:Uncharacterized protein n=1 Tax=Stephania cephalantha TaxID=152367 RepID=A0AAP0KQ66_9MAGN
MENIDIVLHHSIASLEVQRMSARLNIPSREPEKPRAANDRHLPHLREHSVPPHYADRAPIVLPFNEREVHRHDQPDLSLRRHRVQPLRPPHQFRPLQIRPQSQRVVDHDHRPESRGGGPVRGGDHHGCGVGARHHVVPVEAEVGQLLPLHSPAQSL